MSVKKCFNENANVGINKKITDKIIKYKDKDIYIIFFNYNCGCSIMALKLLKEQKKCFKGYNTENIEGNIKRVLQDLKNNHHKIKFRLDHSTIPIIFYKGKFIGGYDDIKSLFLK